MSKKYIFMVTYRVDKIIKRVRLAVNYLPDIESMINGKLISFVFD